MPVRKLIETMRRDYLDTMASVPAGSVCSCGEAFVSVSV